MFKELIPVCTTSVSGSPYVLYEYRIVDTDFEHKIYFNSTDNDFFDKFIDNFLKLYPTQNIATINLVLLYKFILKCEKDIIYYVPGHCAAKVFFNTVKNHYPEYFEKLNKHNILI